MKISTAVLLAAIVLPSCSSPVPIHVGPRSVPPQVITFSSPDYGSGDPIAGRHEFIQMQCIDCHQVAADPALPRGRRAVAGPLLSGLRAKTPDDVGDRIRDKSTGADQDLFDRTMKDYAQPLTAQQLVDIVAYLRRPELGRSGGQS
jgi:mono/diheme cytochrome c family protein